MNDILQMCYFVKSVLFLLAVIPLFICFALNICSYNGLGRDLNIPRLCQQLLIIYPIHIVTRYYLSQLSRPKLFLFLFVRFHKMGTSYY